MKHAYALRALLEKLAILGHTGDAVEVREVEPEKGEAPREGEVQVTLDFAHGNRITITVGDHWRYPGMSSYFVNFNHPSGDFACNPGTPLIDRVMFDIGYCTAKFVQPK